MPPVGESAFFADAARERVTEAVADAETRTAAEFVVVVRHASSRWREVDMAAGALVAFSVLLLLLFHPREIPVEAMPLDVLIAFAAGAVLTSSVGTVKRALLPRKSLRERVGTAARAAFVEQGIARTEKRTGVLVYVSMLERAVELVVDVRVDAKLLESQAAALTASIARGADLDAFLAALRALGPALSASLPHGEHDVNELPDAPVVT